MIKEEEDRLVHLHKALNPHLILNQVLHNKAHSLKIDPEDNNIEIIEKIIAIEDKNINYPTNSKRQN